MIKVSFNKVLMGAITAFIVVGIGWAIAYFVVVGFGNDKDICL